MSRAGSCSRWSTNLQILNWVLLRCWLPLYTQRSQEGWWIPLARNRGSGKKPPQWSKLAGVVTLDSNSEWRTCRARACAPCSSARGRVSTLCRSIFSNTKFTPNELQLCVFAYVQESKRAAYCVGSPISDVQIHGQHIISCSNPWEASKNVQRGRATPTAAR